MSLRCLIFTTLLLTVGLQLHAQLNPPFGDAFEQEQLPTFNLQLDTGLWSWLLADSNLYQNVYQPCGISYTNGSGVTAQYTGAGMRLRGNTSREADKKSIKLHFTKFGGEAEFFDHKKVNIKGSHNDPTILRERLAYWMFRSLDGPAPRVNNVLLELNGDYQGVFVNVEQIGGHFLNSRFGNNDGNLYKCAWGASLAPDTDVYDNNVFELETNDSLNNRSDLEELLASLYAPISVNYPAQLEAVLNVDGLLKYLAVEVLIGHWDGYSYNQNNYYLYHNDDTGLFEVIMYDPDNSFGIDWVNRDWATRDIYDWANHGGERPLYQRVLGITSYRNQFTVYLNELLTGAFHPDNAFPLIDDWAHALYPYVINDPLYPLDWDFSAPDYLNHIDEAWGGHLAYGLKPYIAARWQSAMDQLDTDALTAPELHKQSQWRLQQQPGRAAVQLHSAAAVSNVMVHVWDVRGSLFNSQQLAQVQPGQVLELDLPAGIALVQIQSSAGSETLKAFQVID